MPTNLTVTPLNSTSLVISWFPPPVSQQNGIIRHYTINLQHNSTGLTNVYTLTNDTQMFITNLTPFHSYSIEIAAFTIGIGPYTSAVSVQLPESGNLTVIYVT